MKKKWAVKRITINLANIEAQKLSDYCALTGRPATDVIRELIRSLDTDNKQLILQHSTELDNFVELESLESIT